jgi:putative membrane protein
MRALTSVLVLSALLAGAPAFAQTAAQLSKQDHDFATQALAGNMLEVQLGTMAQQRGDSSAVKSFGQRMIDDHGKNNQQLIAITSRYGITPPLALPADEQRKVDKVAKLNGATFDSTYSKMMVDDHQQDIKQFQKEAQSGQNAELKSYAQQTLPILQQHLQLAQDMSAPKVGGAAGEGSQEQAETTRKK